MPSYMRDFNERVGIVDNVTLVQGIVADLRKDGYLTQVFPQEDWTGLGPVILEPSTQVDFLYTKPNAEAGINPTSWRIAFWLDEEKVMVNVATSLQLMDDGTIARATWDAEAKNPGEITFVDRSHLDSTGQAVYPMTSTVSISDHGIFIGVWDHSTDEYQDENNYISPSFRWINVQRAVTHDTGNVYLDGHQPVFCVYTVMEKGYFPLRESQLPYLAPASSGSSTGGTTNVGTGGASGGGSSVSPPGVQQQPSGPDYDIQVGDVIYRKATGQMHRRFVVRERNIYRPSLSRPADQNTEDVNAILNSSYQVSIAEDQRYVVTIPKGLNTTRFSYTHELDQIAFTSADVIGHTSILDVATYGTTYRYRAMPANRTRNTGMRILCRVLPTTTAT